MNYTYNYPRPAVTADCIVVTREQQPKVLLIQRGIDPYKGCWAFPGGFMNMDETTEECAIRELKEETGLKVKTVYQVGTYSEVDRDPRGRTITVAYLAIVDKVTKVKGRDDAAKAEWFPVNNLPELAFDHDEILLDAVILFSKKKYENIKGKKLSDSDKIDILTKTIVNAFIDKIDEIGYVEIPITAYAIARLYARFMFMTCGNSENPEKVIEIYLDALKLSIERMCIEMKIELNDEIIRLSKERISQLEKVIQNNEREIEEKRQELLRKMGENKNPSNLN